MNNDLVVGYHVGYGGVEFKSLPAELQTKYEGYMKLTKPTTLVSIDYSVKISDRVYIIYSTV